VMNGRVFQAPTRVACTLCSLQKAAAVYLQHRWPKNDAVDDIAFCAVTFSLCDTPHAHTVQCQEKTRETLRNVYKVVQRTQTYAPLVRADAASSSIRLRITRWV